MASKGRIAWIDWARALGACSIVLLHVLVSTSRAADLGLPRLAAYDLTSIALCRWAVPAFFMISGYLLLDPRRTLGWKQAKRYALRMALVLATFGLAFALMEEGLGFLGAGEGSWWQVPLRAVVDVLTASTWDHLWYVYAIMVVYLLLPVLRSIARRLGRVAARHATTALAATTLGVPTVAGMVQSYVGDAALVATSLLVALLAPLVGENLASFVSNLAVGVACTCVGGCLHGVRLSRRNALVGVGSLLVMLFVSERSLLAGTGDAGYVFLQGSCFAAAYAAFVLLVLRRALGSRRLDSHSLVARLARDSFGVYVVHPFFIHAVLMVVDPLVLPAGVFEVGLFAVTLAASIASTRLLRHVPLVGTLL